MAIKRINFTMGYDGLLPTLLVFEALPYFPASGIELSSQTESFSALRTCGEEMATIPARDRLALVLSLRLSPAPNFISTWAILFVSTGSTWEV